MRKGRLSKLKIVHYVPFIEVGRDESALRVTLLIPRWTSRRVTVHAVLAVFGLAMVCILAEKPMSRLCTDQSGEGVQWKGQR